MSNDTAIKIQGLTKVYKLYESPMSRLKEALHPFKKKYHRDFHALQNLSLEIKKGECVGIIGKNGSGKSTLLKVITGVLTPTSGSVTVQGKVSAILELGAGFNPEMTGVENIYLNNALNGMTKAQTDKKIKEIIEFADLGDFIHQPIKTYSSGMKARLAFAVSINVEPDILIVDEALSVGDASFGRKCFAKMEEIRAKGATILFVSHSEASIVSLCSRALWINNGDKIIEGIPKLVTGLYMKHVSRSVTKKQIANEYAALFALALGGKNGFCKASDEFKDRLVKDIDFVSLPQFNHNIKSVSSVSYEPKGAYISDVRITTTSGEEVNILVQGGTYIYSYNVIADEHLNNVHFGMHMKDVKGVVLAGSTYPSKTEYLSLPPGQYKISFTFTNLFNTKEVFCSAGIRSSSGDFIHRIIDNYLFVVKAASNKNTGLVSLVQNGGIS